MADAVKPLGGAGLRGQSAGETALCTVGKVGAGLPPAGSAVISGAYALDSGWLDERSGQPTEGERR